MEKFPATFTKACKSQTCSFEQTAFTEELDQKTPSEVAGKAAKVIVNRVLGDGGADLMEHLFGVVRAKFKLKKINNI